MDEQQQANLNKQAERLDKLAGHITGAATATLPVVCVPDTIAKEIAQLLRESAQNARAAATPAQAVGTAAPAGATQ